MMVCIFPFVCPESPKGSPHASAWPVLPARSVGRATLQWGDMSRMTPEQFRRLQSELAAEEMKLTIMRQMRQSQRADNYSSPSHQSDPSHPQPSFQRAQEPVRMQSGQAASPSSRSYRASPPAHPRSSSSRPTAEGPVYHQQPQHASGPSPPHRRQHYSHYGDQRIDYRDMSARSERRTGMNNESVSGLPPPPPLRQLGRSTEMDIPPLEGSSASLPQDSPPSLMPRSQLEHERQALKAGQRSGTPPLLSERAAMAAGYSRPRISTSPARGRHSPALQQTQQPHRKSPSHREYTTAASSIRLASNTMPHPPRVVAHVQDARSKSAMLQQVASRLNELHMERDQLFSDIYLPSKPPQYTWSLVPSAPSNVIMNLIGMDECIQRIEAAAMGLELPDPEKVAAVNRPVCAHCGSDFAKFWRSFEDNGKMVIVCEDCDWVRVKKPFVQQHIVRLRECLPKIDAITEEMEALQHTAGRSVIATNRLNGR